VFTRPVCVLMNGSLLFRADAIARNPHGGLRACLDAGHTPDTRPALPHVHGAAPYEDAAGQHRTDSIITSLLKQHGR
jgi:hypothetical protein